MYNYFVKCDISGIQQFIFDVASDGAARELKKRSAYVQKIADDCYKVLKEFFGNNVDLVYNGGGNFCFEAMNSAKTKEDLSVFIKQLQEKYLKKDIFPFIAFIDRDTDNISNLLNAISQELKKRKHQRPVWCAPFHVEAVEMKDVGEMKGVNGQVPKGDFNDIAERSTGAIKLAALKLDVDNLGALFRDRTREEYKKLSEALKKFFGDDLKQLIETEKMQQYIYVVFSGGDDCFLVGTWEKIFDFAITLRQKFREFQEKLRKDIGLKLDKDDKDITFSAGLIVVHPKYPMLRLSEEVEEALSASKSADCKDSINCFGKSLRWNEFEKSQKIALQLFDLVKNKGESNSLIERIKLSSIGFAKIQQDAQKGRMNLPKVWRLKYYLRNVRAENRIEIEKLFEEYSNAIVKTFLNKSDEKVTNPYLFPIAARWAELLLKKES